MKKIGVTVEIIHRRYEEIMISDEDYDALLAGATDEYSIYELDLIDLFEKCRNDDEVDSDYAITDENGNDIVPWKDGR